jgi:alpha-1,6-mannosyltransferase
LGVTTLHITNWYHPTSGGIRTFYHALLESANVAGRYVRLVVPGQRAAVEAIGRFGRIYQVPALPAPAFDRRYRMILPHAYLPWFPSRLVEILEQEHPDVVEICDKYSLPYLAAMLRKRWHPRVSRPVLVGLSAERLDDNVAAHLSGSKMARALTRWYVRHIYGPPFDAHIAVSEYTAAELRGALGDREPWFIRTCPMGVDMEAFDPDHRSREVRGALLRQAGGSARTVLLFYAGRLSPEKNIGLLVEAVHELSRDASADYRLIVAGEGPARDLLRGHGTRICLCGNLDKITLARYLASCDVFVHPNPREPFGIGPLEAMASGLPVVVPNAGGVLEYASSANAWLAEPTAVAFAEAIRAASRSDPRRILAARETVARFSWRDATRRYFDAYDELHRRFSMISSSKRASAA